MSPLRIVHVDDEEVLLQMVRAIITAKFNNVTIQGFQDSNEAWQELLRADPCLLITDDKMPGPTGEDLVRWLGQKQVQYPIIVTSAWPPTEQWVRKYSSIKENIVLLRCPFTPDDLCKQLRQFLPAASESPNARPNSMSQDTEPTRDTTLRHKDPLARALIKRYRSIEEAEVEHMVTDARLGDVPVPFGFDTGAWSQLLALMQDGDELWTFSTSDESWKHLAGREGISLVRAGEVITSIVAAMN
jgi:DNA-binding NtrC family response regulator